MNWDGIERRRQPTEIQESLKRIELAMYGNWREGVMIRVDRMEQVIKQLTWFMATTATVVIGMVVYTLAELVKHT